MARPVEWTPRKIKKLINLLKKYIKEASQREEKMSGNIIAGSDFPSIQEFLRTNELCSSKYIFELSKKPENLELSDSIARLKDLQAEFALKYGMNRMYSERLAMFALQNVTEWREKQEVDQKGTTKIVINRAEYDGREDENS